MPAIHGEAAGPLYPKIQSIWKRTRTGLILRGDYSTDEIEFLAKGVWHWYEKVDGTNIRLHWNGWDRWLIGGRTDNAQIPGTLYNHLVSILPTIDESRAQFDDPVTIYGEGYGAGIQKGGGKYRPDVGFIVFDIRVGDWWLHWDNVLEVCEALHFESVPFLGEATLPVAERIVTNGLFESRWEGVTPEGLVGRPRVELHDRRGNRILVKMKGRDYQ